MYKLAEILEINQSENILSIPAPQMSTDICGAAYSCLYSFQANAMGTGPAGNMNVPLGAGTTYVGSNRLFIKSHLSLLLGDTYPLVEQGAVNNYNYAGGVQLAGHSVNSRRIVYATNDRIAILHLNNQISTTVGSPLLYSVLALPLYNSNAVDVNIRLDAIWSNRNEPSVYGGCYSVLPHYVNDTFVDYCLYDMLAYYTGNTSMSSVSLYVSIPAKTTIILVNATGAFYDASTNLYHTTGFYNLTRLGTTYPGVLCDTRMLEVMRTMRSSELHGAGVSGGSEFEILYNQMHKWYGVENARII